MNRQCHHSFCSTFFFALLVTGIGFPAWGATITWTNTSGGNWSVTNNWSPNQVPGAADTALMTTSGTYAITNNANSQVASLMLGAAAGTQTLTVNGSMLSLANGGTVGAHGILNFSGSTLTGSLTVNGTLNWSNGGSLSGGSSLTIATNAVLNIGGIYNESLNGMLTNAGTVNWTGTFPFLAPIYWFSLLLNWKRPPGEPEPAEEKNRS
jgi:hypothetical protein